MTRGNWRTPGVILVCGGIILTIALGTRHNFGLYLQPVTVDLGIGRGVIAHVFGVKYLSTLSGIAFLFHQVGSFLGVWLGGYLFDATGSYNVMWGLTIAMGVVAALLNLPIDERQIARPAPTPA